MLETYRDVIYFVIKISITGAIKVNYVDMILLFVDFIVYHYSMLFVNTNMCSIFYMEISVHVNLSPPGATCVYVNQYSIGSVNG